MASLNPNLCAGDIVTPREAQVIDQKSDDGGANTGNVLGAEGTGAPSGCISSGAYQLSSTAVTCRLFFYTD